MRFRYFRSVAFAVGVPPFWIEDAVQDIALTVWRRGNDRAGTVRSAAIDAVRHYGPRSRAGVRRDLFVSLEQLRIGSAA